MKKFIDYNDDRYITLDKLKENYSDYLIVKKDSDIYVACVLGTIGECKYCLIDIYSWIIQGKRYTNIEGIIKDYYSIDYDILFFEDSREMNKYIKENINVRN